jgi:hypothetical protein
MIELWVLEDSLHHLNMLASLIVVSLDLDYSTFKNQVLQ